MPQKNNRTGHGPPAMMFSYDCFNLYVALFTSLLANLNLNMFKGQRSSGTRNEDPHTTAQCFWQKKMPYHAIPITPMIWSKHLMISTHSTYKMTRNSILSQDPLMFSGTLRFNLDFQSHHSDEEIWNALRLARLEKLVMDLPSQLDEMVQEILGRRRRRRSVVVIVEWWKYHGTHWVWRWDGELWAGELLIPTEHTQEDIRWLTGRQRDTGLHMAVGLCPWSTSNTWPK